MTKQAEAAVLSPKQQETWDFIAKHIFSGAGFPKYIDIAGHFNISTAAVAHILNALEKKQRLLRNSCFPFPLLLDEEHNIFTPGNSHAVSDAGLCRHLPENFKLTCKENTALTVVSGNLFKFGIREGDIIEICKLKVSEIKPGDILVIICGNTLLLRFAAAGNLKCSDLYINPRDKRFIIAGKVIKLYRQMF